MTSPAGRKKWLLFFRTGRGNLSSQHCKSIPQGTENWYSYVSTPTRLISLTNQHLVFLSCEQCLHCPIDWGFVTPCNPVHILYHTRMTQEASPGLCLVCIFPFTDYASSQVYLYLIATTVTAKWMSFLFQLRCINTAIQFPESFMRIDIIARGELWQSGS